MVPTIHVDLLDSRVTLAQKRKLAQSLTRILSETLGYSEEGVTVIFRSVSTSNIARDGKLGRQ
jgi:phenylpyruvate tautomerase PptA (4-oxalocrotonate tautomerase family)